ncbi:hypothetical protein PG993_009118 [Apiospora rasikravindrae]|uniref:Cytochrome P450 monooxygenase n=1 Tax=Apiospora rasikravindrae TaxID=990691 RepID=A0ABR1SIG5_9PEZI
MSSYQTFHVMDGLQRVLASFCAASATAALLAAVSFVLYSLSYPIYALFLHPLSSVPGPKLSACTRIPYWVACIQGRRVRHMTKLHQIYGPVVRFGPNDLSYSDGRAWRDICLEVRFHAPSANSVHNIIAEPDHAKHAALRQVFSPAFSEQALRRQEPLLRKYADFMIARARQAGTVNMTQLLNFTTFDIMAELAFGEPLGLLERNGYSDWVATVFDTVRVLPYLQLIEFYPLSRMIFRLLEPKSVVKMRLDHFNHTVTRVTKRLEKGSDKPDIWSLVVDSHALLLDDMHANAELFMIAGTETTASLLTGLTYCLVTNPDKMKILTDEIRHVFPRSNAISIEELPKLKYLNAYYADDKRDAHQPFSIGPRNCIGMNLAWHEMRLIVAKLLYNFDLESHVGTDWLDQNVYVIWDRKPLMCRLKYVK